MASLRIFTDEDVYSAVAPLLRTHGVESLSAPEAGRLGISDEQQLEWATHERFVILTFNVADFARLHARWMKAGQHHAGIIVSAQIPIGQLIHRLTNVISSLDADAFIDRLEFLGDWR